MKKFLAIMFLAILLISVPVTASPQDTASVDHGKYSLVFAMGAAFPTSPRADLSLNTGLVKKTMILYDFSNWIKIGGMYGGSDFHANSLTSSDLVEYGGVAIFHTLVTPHLGAFFQVQVTSQTFDGGPFELGQMTGFGTYWKSSKNAKLIPLVAVNFVPVNIETKTNALTIYGGVEVSQLF